MYVFKHVEFESFSGTFSTLTTLIEMTADEFATTISPARVEYERVSAERARQWVLDGGHHSTPLYVDINERGTREGVYVEAGPNA